MLLFVFVHLLLLFATIAYHHFKEHDEEHLIGMLMLGQQPQHKYFDVDIQN